MASGEPHLSLPTECMSFINVLQAEWSSLSALLASSSSSPSLSMDRFLWFGESCKPHTSLQDWWLVNNISQHYGPHRCRTESIWPSKKSNQLTWPSSAGLTLQEMSFFKESASALLIHPTPRSLDEDLLLLVFLAVQDKLVKAKWSFRLKE